VDFEDAESVAKARALSENRLDGRALLVKDVSAAKGKAAPKSR
jgi:hypothetical protein